MWGNYEGNAISLKRDTKVQLNKLTTEFYEITASSFSETRTAPWSGWRQIRELIEQQLMNRGSKDPTPHPLSLLDIGCGNLRFERFLASEDVLFQATCADNCRDLVQSGLGESIAAQIRFVELDIANTLIEEEDVAEKLSLDKESQDVICAFGFFHHIPSQSHRLALLQSLIKLLKPGGLLAVSFWQFEKDARIFSKAQVATDEARELYKLIDLEPGDYLLGWQDKQGLYRYCHSFSEEEITSLVQELGSQVAELARFSADGKSGDLNRYIVIQKRPGDMH